MICAVLGFGLPALVCATFIAAGLIDADERAAQREHELRQRELELQLERERRKRK